MADMTRPSGHAPWRLRARSRPDEALVRGAAVLGLGRFGSALATELERLGVEVLGIDADEDTVQRHDPLLTAAVRADVSRAEVLDQLGVTQADRVVVAVGGRLETSVLACTHLLRAGVEDLWAKAESAEHAQILEQLGVRHVIMTQRAMGVRIAHRLVDRAEDWVDYGHGLQMGRFAVPVRMLHQTVAASRVTEEWALRVIARRSGDAPWEYVTAQTVLQPGDELIVAGSAEELAAFGRLDS